MRPPTIDPLLTVFTKPWKTLSLEALADQVANWGFHGIELPVRPGFQVEPQNAIEALPRGVARFVLVPAGADEADPFLLLRIAVRCRETW